MTVIRAKFGRMIRWECESAREIEEIEKLVAKIIQIRPSRVCFPVSLFQIHEYPMQPYPIYPSRYAETDPIIIISALGSQRTIRVQERPKCSLSFESNARISYPLQIFSKEQHKPLHKRIILPHPRIPDRGRFLLPILPGTIDLQIQRAVAFKTVRLQRRDDVVDGRRDLVLLVG